MRAFSGCGLRDLRDLEGVRLAAPLRWVGGCGGMALGSGIWRSGGGRGEGLVFGAWRR